MNAMMDRSEKPQSGERDEIKITPAMIEAGCAVLDDYDRRFDADYEIVARIYSAMAAVAASSPRKTDRSNSQDEKRR